jgi:2-aminoadipate transaminase
VQCGDEAGAVGHDLLHVHHHGAVLPGEEPGRRLALDDQRYTACLAALDELMPDGVKWTTPGGGPTLWLEIPASIDLAALEAHLARRNVVISNKSAAFLGDPHLHGFRIAYAWLAEHEMRAALTILADALRQLG